MTKNFYLFVLLSFIFTSISQADTEQSSPIQDSKAKIVLDKASEVYKENTGIYSKFTLNIEVPEGKPIVRQGEIYLKGNKYKVVFSDQEIYSNEKYVWTYLKDANEVQINDYESDPGDISPSNMFNIYHKDFNYMKSPDEVISGQKCYVIELSPIDKSRTYFKIKLWINQKTNLLSKIRIFDKNGYRYNYIINSINHKANLRDSQFNFSKENYPGVKVEDLRF